MFQNACLITSARQCSGMIYDARREAVQTYARPYEHTDCQNQNAGIHAQALYIAPEIAFGIDGLVDGFPSPFLFGHSMQPKQAQLNMFQVALMAEVPLKPKPGFRFQVQTARRRRWGT
jgi:hypothetical protein